MVRTDLALLMGRIGIVLSALILMTAANAQTGNLKIGVVNVSRLLQEAPQAQTAMAALQEEFAPRQRKIVAMQKDLQDKQQTLQRDGAVMAEEERMSLERDVRDGQRNLKREQDEYLEDLNVRKNEELSKLQRSLLQQVQTYARNANYDLVVSDVLFYSSAVDITEDVLKGLQDSHAAAQNEKKN
jgi:outer membrane protein